MENILPIFLSSDRSIAIAAIKKHEKDHRLRKTDLNDVPQSGAVVS
jgi:hypothetical protein